MVRVGIVLALATASAASLGAGCEAPPTTDRREAAILGGTADHADTGVVLIAVNRQGSTESFCTGEVIAPTVVVTAAHCFEAANRTYQVYLGEDFNNPSGADLVEVIEAHSHPSYDPDHIENGFDIAVVITATPLARPVLTINRDPLDASMLGLPVRLIGWGTTTARDPNLDTAGVRRETTSSLTAFDSWSVTLEDGNHNTCDGDSGGPGLMTINGSERIVALTSYGDSNCTTGGVYTRVDHYLAFLDSFLPTTPASTDLAGIADGGAPELDAGAPPSGPAPVGGSPPGVGPDSANDSGGCSVGSTSRPAPALVWLVVMLALLIRRSRRSRVPLRPTVFAR